jgi:hypothetical protein
MNEYIKILGFPVRDTVTGFEGVVTSVGFDLYGCVQCIVQPSAKEQKLEDSRWFDHKRLTPIAKEPVMKVPTFVAPSLEAGPAEKPRSMR